MQMLNFVEAVVMSFRVVSLHIYLICMMLCWNCYLVMNRENPCIWRWRECWLDLGEAVIDTLLEFENAVERGKHLRKHGGEIHSLCRYVINYVKLLLECHLLSRLWEKYEGEWRVNQVIHSYGDSRSITSIERHLQYLRTNLEEKSRFT